MSGVQSSLATEQMPAPSATSATSTKLGGAEAAQAEQLEHLREASLGEYEIYGELGRGGMATVYLAHEIALDRKVAIKVMSPALVHGEGMVERFKREARTSASLSHPNIIPVYAVRETERILYFVMKFVQGRPLDSIIKELGPLPIPMVQAILSQVGGAFGYAHRRGIIHRDIKPANIMIDDEGWSVVTDFGIAKVSESQGLTMTGMTVGTPTYMSPEQCMAQEVTGASDQYSLGVVVYEMLTGRPPFTGASMMAIMYGHFNDPPPPIEKLRPDCPDALKAAVLRMLEKDPANRWPSVEEAVAGIGNAPLSHDDPTRTQLIALARSGASRQALLTKMSTPTSPIPKTRSRVGTAPLSASGRPAPKGRTAPAVVASPPAPKSRLGLVLGLVVGLAAVAGVLYLAPWKPHAAPSEPTPVPVEATSPQSAPATSIPGSENGSATGQPAATPDPVAIQPPPAPPPAKPSAQAVAAAAQAKHDQEEYQRLQGQALEARGRAGASGATPGDLSSGDLLRNQAEAFAARAKYDLALKPISEATSAYVQAAVTAQNRAAAAVAQAQAARVAASEAAPKPSPLVQTQPPPPPPASTQPADERPAVEQALREYARALAASDLTMLLRVYPGMPANLQEGLKEFFRAGNSLETSKWNIFDVVVNGPTASAKIGGVTIARDKKGKPSNQDPPKTATLERGASGWRITAIN